MRQYKISNTLLQANHLLRQHGSYSDGCPVRNSGVPRQPKNIFWKIWTPILPRKL